MQSKPLFQKSIDKSLKTLQNLKKVFFWIFKEYKNIYYQTN